MKVEYNPMNTCKQRQKKIVKRTKQLYKIEKKIMKEEGRNISNEKCDFCGSILLKNDKDDHPEHDICNDCSEEWEEILENE